MSSGGAGSPSIVRCIDAIPVGPIDIELNVPLFIGAVRVAEYNRLWIDEVCLAVTRGNLPVNRKTRCCAVVSDFGFGLVVKAKRVFRGRLPQCREGIADGVVVAVKL